MKNLNKWFFFNPLFVLYTDAKFYISMLKDPDQIMSYFTYRIHDEDFDPFDYDERQMDLRDSVEIESQMVNHESAHRLRQRFAENKEFHYFLGYSLNDDFQKLPIALITFVLSVFLATDFSFRQNFYTLYQGKKIPAITQWCLNTFRVSPISDNETISDFDFIDDEYQATLFCCGLGNTFADKDSLKHDLEDMVAWFYILEDHFNSDQPNYMEPVDFKRISHVSTEKNYLCGLTVKNEAVTCDETAYFHELSHGQKETYTMLAQVLDTVCVPENTILPVPHRNLLERDFDEREMTAKLIRFIVLECKTFL